MAIPNIYKSLVTKITIMITKRKQDEWSRQMDIEIKKGQTLNSIVDLIRKKPISIAEITRRLRINRSTLRYYLSILKEERLIKAVRQENMPGRPTLIQIDQEAQKKEFEKLKQRVKEHEEQMNKSPYTKKILSLLSQKKECKRKDFVDACKDLSKDEVYVAKTMHALNWLVLKKRVEEVFRSNKKKK